MNPRIKKIAQRLMLLSSLLLMACQPNNTPTPTKETCMQLNAEQAGREIVAIYRTAIADTTMLLKNQPDATTIENQFDGLLTTWQQQLLKIGQHVVVMEIEQKKQVEQAIRQEHMNMQYNDEAKQQFAAFSRRIFPYHNTHPKFYQKLKSINIITQFAFFDLLRKQNPDWADRYRHLMQAVVCS